MATWYDLTSDRIEYKGKIMANFNALKDGSAVTYTTAQRVALAATLGTVVYDSDLTALYQYNGSTWVEIA